jgi:hypothetical protein
MKAIGRKSVSSVLKKIISVIFYLEFLLVLTLPMVFLDDDGIRYSWPVTLDAINIQPVVTSAKPRITDFAVHERYQISDQSTKKVLSFEDATMGRRLLQTLHNIVNIAAILLITCWLKKLFTDLASNKPFTDKNSKRVQWISWVVLALVFFDVIQSLLYRAYTASTVSITGASLDVYDFGFDGRAFLLGLLLLVIAELFKRGYEYQSDSESIV